MPSLSAISAVTRKAALEEGFDLAGIAPAQEFVELRHFSEWVASGYAGEMQYMEARDDAGRLKRSSLHSVAPWARSVIVCAINYNTAHSLSTEPAPLDRGWISRYAWCREDYHDSVMRKLKVVERKLAEYVREASVVDQLGNGPRAADPLLYRHRPNR